MITNDMLALTGGTNVITRARGAKGGQGGGSYMYIATQKYLRELWDLNKGTRTGNYESDRTNSDGIQMYIQNQYKLETLKTQRLYRTPKGN